MKTTPFRELKDQYVGAPGTPERAAYEAELSAEIAELNEAQPKEWVILAKRHEKSGGPNIGAPFYGPNYAGYTMRLTGAGLYTEQQARKEANGCGKGELIPYHFADPELREYLAYWHVTRSSEFDLFHKAQALQKFKDYVHGRLDLAGISKHEEQNALNGCRIGARLNDVLNLWVSFAERLPAAGQEVIVRHVEQVNPRQTNCMVATFVPKHPRADEPGLLDNYGNTWLVSRHSHWMPVPAMPL